MTELELLIRKNALKDVELWLYSQYAKIDKELMQFTEDRGDDSAEDEAGSSDEDLAMGMSFQDWRVENDHE